MLPESAPLGSARGTRLLGRYELEVELARGGMGSVWRAKHLGLGTDVAVKFATGAGATMSARLFAEARTAAALGSPHIVRVFDIGEEEGVPFLVMELLQGETLSDRLHAEGRLSARETFALVEEVSRGLEVAHQAGVIHRDLKPSNIFLVPNGTTKMAKILDFGIARTPGSNLTASGELVGTPRYMSPEQADDEASVDARSDLWSLALIATECLLGQSVHGDKSIARILRDLGERPLVLPPSAASLGPSFDAWFARATQSEPDRRFQTAGELVSSLRAALEEESLIAPLPVDRRHDETATRISALPAEDRKSSTKVRRTRLKGWLFAGLALLVGVGGFVSFDLGGGREPDFEEGREEAEAVVDRKDSEVDRAAFEEELPGETPSQEAQPEAPPEQVEEAAVEKVAAPAPAPVVSAPKVAPRPPVVQRPPQTPKVTKKAAPPPAPTAQPKASVWEARK